MCLRVSVADLKCSVNSLSCDVELGALPTPFPLGDAEGAQSAFAAFVEADYEINRRRVKSKLHVRGRRRGVTGSRVRVVDGRERFDARAHAPLRVKEFFGRSLVRDRARARDVAKRIDRQRFRLATAEQPAALLR